MRGLGTMRQKTYFMNSATAASTAETSPIAQNAKHATAPLTLADVGISKDQLRAASCCLLLGAPAARRWSLDRIAVPARITALAVIA